MGSYTVARRCISSCMMTLPIVTTTVEVDEWWIIIIVLILSMSSCEDIYRRLGA